MRSSPGDDHPEPPIHGPTYAADAARRMCQPSSNGVPPPPPGALLLPVSLIVWSLSPCGRSSSRMPIVRDSVFEVFEHQSKEVGGTVSWNSPAHSLPSAA